MKKMNLLFFRQALKIKKGTIIKNINNTVSNIFESIVTQNPSIDKKNLSLILKVEKGKAVAILLHDDNKGDIEELAKEPISTAIKATASPEQLKELKEILAAETLESILCKLVGERVFLIGYDTAPKYEEITPNGVEVLDLGEFISSIKF